jgi:hypothetical protein
MKTISASSAARRAAAIAASCVAVACLAGASAPGARSASTRGAPATALRAPAWRVTTLEHVDLWLHGFALLTSDTGHVPFFARGYKQRVTAAKRQRNLYTQLDANQQELSSRFASNPALTNAQFLAMYFDSFQEIVNATDYFIRSNGNPRAASDPRVQQSIALLAANFRSPADRNWLRLFVQSLQDEDTKFFHSYWTTEQSNRGAGFAAFQEQWLSKYYPKLSRFLNNTQQASGQVVLSITLGGEGRTVNDGKRSNLIAVELPPTAEAAPEALFGFVHEAVATLAQEAINDNTTAAQQRSGEANGYTGNAAVRGGAVLLQKIAPDLVPDYMRFYLRTLNDNVAPGDPTAAFTSTFALPQTILDALSKQIDLVLGGI